MDDTALGIVVLVGGIAAFLVIRVILSRLISKGVDAAYETGRKALFKKQIAESDDLIDVPLVLATSASPQEFLEALDAIVHPQKTPPGFDAVLYEVSREPMSVTYAVGSKLQPQELVTEIRLSEHEGTTDIVLRVLHAERRQGIFAYKEVLKRLREQVEYAAASAGDSAALTRATEIYRSADPGPAKTRVWLWRSGLAVGAGALIWLGTGVQVSLLPLWFGLLVLAGVLMYVARLPVAKRLRAEKAAALEVLHPDGMAPRVAANDRSVVQPQDLGAFDDGADETATPRAAAVSAPEPTSEDFALAADELAASSELTPRSTPVAAFSKLSTRVVLIACVVVIVGVIGIGFLSQGGGRASTADLNAETADDAPVYEDEDYETTADRPLDEVDPYTLSPDSHARMEMDLIGSAPEDGSVEIAKVVWLGGGMDADAMSFEFTVTSRDPAEWYQAYWGAYLPCYIDGIQVDPDDMFRLMDGDAWVEGLVVFNSWELLELHVLNPGEDAAWSLDDDAMTIVPDQSTLDLPYGEWENLEWGEAMDAHIAAIEEAFEQEGLVAVVSLIPYSGVEEVSQTPAAGEEVPEGTHVYITIPVVD